MVSTHDVQAENGAILVCPGLEFQPGVLAWDVEQVAEEGFAWEKIVLAGFVFKGGRVRRYASTRGFDRSRRTRWSRRQPRTLRNFWPSGEASLDKYTSEKKNHRNNHNRRCHHAKRIIEKQSPERMDMEEQLIEEMPTILFPSPHNTPLFTMIS